METEYTIISREALGQKLDSPDLGKATSYQPSGEPYLWIREKDKTGSGESHQRFEDIFVVIEGNPIFMIGGELDEPEEKSPGEMKGKSVKNGTRIQLKPGDTLSILPGVPHQRLANGDILLMVVKVPR